MAAPPKRSVSADDDDALRVPRTLHERTYMSELGQRLRALREERGMTQQALAKAAGIATDMVSRLENGHYTSPGLRTLVRLAEGMGVGVAALLPELASATLARDPDAAARARLQALLARASTSDVELIADLAAAVLANRH
jgi:transcriptional regulator with XRE-family HTH domain